MKLTAKVGAGHIIKDLVQQVDTNGNPKVWSASEMENALQYIEHVVETFDKQQALHIISVLMNKFDISKESLTFGQTIPDITNVQGLQ